MALIRRVRAVVEGVPGSPAYSNFYVANVLGDPDDYIAPVGNLMQGLSQYMVNECTWRVEPDVPLIDSVTGDIQAVGVGGVVTGTGLNSGEMLPSATCLLLRWRTPVFQSGRRLQGRTFVSYLGEDQNENGKPSAATLSSLAGVMAQYLLDAQGQAVVWSRTTGAIGQAENGGVAPFFAQLRSRRD